MKNKTPITLLTGFLGSGKTTLLNNILQNAKNKNIKIGIIANDFGKSVDSEIIKNKNDIFVYEVSGGSIFCSCRSDAFIDGLRYYKKNEVDILYIEASGLANPSAFFNIVSIDEFLHFYEVENIICLIDAKNFLKIYTKSESVLRQIEKSDTIIVNKIDIIDDIEKKELYQKLLEYTKGKEIIETSFCNLDYSLIKKRMSSNTLGELSECEDTAVKSITLMQTFIEKDNLYKVLKEIMIYSLRIKGYYETDGRVYLINDNAGEIVFEKQEIHSNDIKKGITVLYETNNKNIITDIWKKYI